MEWRKGIREKGKGAHVTAKQGACGGFAVRDMVLGCGHARVGVQGDEGGVDRVGVGCTSPAAERSWCTKKNPSKLLNTTGARIASRQYGKPC
jgi:hypothetical protein